MEFAGESTNVVILARIWLLLEKLRSRSDVTLLLTPHVGSITIEYDPLEITQTQLLDLVHQVETGIEGTIDVSVPCRQFRLPLVMDHPDIQKCINRYMETTRDKAAYLPDNLEYLRLCNGLKSRRDAFDMILNAGYLVAAVGFLCGAPILFPLLPKTLTCQKYNPTRVSTPGGTLGIGGSILSGYTIEQPGGYVMAARTLEMWDASGTKPGFKSDRPWLFEPFDKIAFYEVSVQEYDALAEDFAAGRYNWQISQSTFDVRQTYEKIQAAKATPDVLKYKEAQRKGLTIQEQLERDLYSEWVAETTSENAEESGGALSQDLNRLEITSPMAASVWKIEVKPGDVLKDGQIVAILEAMKMEVNVLAPTGSQGCRVHAIMKKPKSITSAGDVLVIARRDP